MTGLNMEYTFRDFKQKFPKLLRREYVVPLFDAAIRLWIEQFSQRPKKTDPSITDFEDLGKGDYRFVVDGKLTKLRVFLEDQSTAYNPDTISYMAERLLFEGDGATRLMSDLEYFIRNFDLKRLEQAASQNRV